MVPEIYKSLKALFLEIVESNISERLSSFDLRFIKNPSSILTVVAVL